MNNSKLKWWLSKKECGDKAKIFQNEALQSTTVVYEGCRDNCRDYIYRRTQNIMVNLDMPDRIVATVRLHPDDQYDEKEGIRQAFRKCDRNHNKALRAGLRRYMQYLIRLGRAVDEDLFTQEVEKVLFKPESEG